MSWAEGYPQKMAELLCDAMGIEVKLESARAINGETALTLVDVGTVHDDRLRNFLDALGPGDYAPNDLTFSSSSAASTWR
eukprot:15301915-Alexandrium_andersonii.AAC.1